MHSLIQCMLDLKRSLGEAVEITPMKKKEEEGDGESRTNDGTTEDAKPQATTEKAVEPDGAQPMDTQEEDENDDDLYGGL